MANQEKPPAPGQPHVEKRSLTTTLAAAALTGTTAGAANAGAQHLLGKFGVGKPQQPKK